MRLLQLALERISVDKRCQARAATNEGYVASLAEYLEAKGAHLPPVVVFKESSTYWLADGFHRHKAHKQAGRKFIEAEVREGTMRDAILFATGANIAHGLHRSIEDKRRAVLLVLTDSEWRKWPKLRIAKHCGVSDTFVASLKDQLEEWEESQKRRTEQDAQRKKDISEGTIKPDRAPCESENEPACEADGETEESQDDVPEEPVAVSELAGRRSTKTFKEMSHTEQRAAYEAENERHRPKWERELDEGLDLARRCALALGKDYKPVLEHIGAAEDAVKVLRKARKKGVVA